ncbi:MAG TPA: hypothetical protein VF535_12595 [Allosphingosinicella sp.]|jgi:hypothetical protein
MSIESPEAPASDEGSTEKRIWRRPMVSMLDASEAEAADGSGGDANGWVS